jgi:hypothetical protein
MMAFVVGDADTARTLGDWSWLSRRLPAGVHPSPSASAPIPEEIVARATGTVGGHDGFGMSLGVTARCSFLLFLLAYTGSAMKILGVRLPQSKQVEQPPANDAKPKRFGS